MKSHIYYITIRLRDRQDPSRLVSDVFRLSAYDRNHAVRLARSSVNHEKYTVYSISAVRIG